MVFAAVVAGHVVLIYLMARTTELARDNADGFSSLQIHIWPLSEEPATPRISRVAPARKVEPRSAESVAITITEPQQAPDTPGTSIPQVDWAQEAAAVIQDMTRPKSGPRQFGDRQKEEPPPDDRYIHPLVKPPAHRAGDIEILGPGIERRWLGERCYMEFGHPLLELFPAPGPKVNPVRCMMGSSVDGHIFDHLKPEYLKQK